MSGSVAARLDDRVQETRYAVVAKRLNIMIMCETPPLLRRDESPHLM